jgi:hypothetical protein
MKINNKYWINEEGKITRIGYCPYHPKNKLDNWGECDKCMKAIIKNINSRRGDCV